ncbi:MAG: hypothetical protein AAGC55_07185 [Myxococcota bacterium]
MLTAIALWAGVGAGAGCGEDAVLLRPILDAPCEQSAAYPYSDDETLVLSVARTGDEQPLREASIGAGDDFVLPETPFDNDMVVHLSSRAPSGAETAYGRTCTLNINGDSEDSLEPSLYFSRIVQWSSGGSPKAERGSDGLAYASPDGAALFVGDGDRSGAIERFDPLTATYTTLSAELTPRRGAVISALADGRAIITGGENGAGQPVTMIEVLEPQRDAVRQLSVPANWQAVLGHAAATLVDSSVVVTGGYDSSAKDTCPDATATASGWELRFGDGDVLSSPEPLTAEMHFARTGHTMTRLGDAPGADVLVVGGQDGCGQPVPIAELYRPFSGRFEKLAEDDQPGQGAVLNVPRWGHLAIRLPGGFVAIIGGFGPDPASGTGAIKAVREVEIYDPGLSRFTVARDENDWLTADDAFTAQSVTPLPDDRVLVAGGLDAQGNPVASAYVVSLDRINGDVDRVAAESMAIPRAGHSAVLLCDGTVLTVGGNRDPGQNECGDSLAAERYNPIAAGRR